MTNILKTIKHLPKQQFHFSAYLEKHRIGIVLLIIMEPSRTIVAEASSSEVDFALNK